MAAEGHFVEAKQSAAGAARDRARQTTCALITALAPTHVTSPQIGPCPSLCLPFPCFPHNPLLMSLADGCNRPPPLPPSLSLPLHPRAPHLIVCASISASLMGFAPLDTLLRRRVRMLMKSDALITPITLVPMPSHSGAEAMPCTTHIRAQQLKGAMLHAIKWLVHVRIQSMTQQPALHGTHDNNVCTCSCNPTTLPLLPSPALLTSNSSVPRFRHLPPQSPSSGTHVPSPPPTSLAPRFCHSHPQFPASATHLPSPPLLPFTSTVPSI